MCQNVAKDTSYFKRKPHEPWENLSGPPTTGQRSPDDRSRKELKIGYQPTNLKL